MRKFLVILMIFLAGCGYKTRGVMYKEKGVYIRPVVNSINVSTQERDSANYSSYPLFIDKKLTNTIAEKFNIDGQLKVSSQIEDNLKLECLVKEYKKEVLRYADNDDVSEQRLRLFVKMTLFDGVGDLLKTQDIIGETTYYLSGSLAKSETAAQQDLVDDTARRIVEAVVEEW